MAGPDPVDVAIQAALLGYLQTGSYDGVPISYPFVSFTPPATGGYLDARNMLRAAPNGPSMDRFGSTIYTGIFQVDAVMPDGQGEAPGIRLAALVAARFAIGTKLVLSIGRYVKLNDIPTIAAAVKDAPWIRFPVSIPYIAVA